MVIHWDKDKDARGRWMLTVGKDITVAITQAEMEKHAKSPGARIVFGKEAEADLALSESGSSEKADKGGAK